MPNSNQWGDHFPHYPSTDLVDPFGAHDELAFANAMNTGRTALYYQAYFELCEAVTGEKPQSEPPDEDEFAGQVLAFLDKNRERHHEAICVRFKYCERMDKYGYFAIPLPLLLALSGFLLDAFGAVGLASATWLTLKGVLDKFCGCAALPQPR